MGHPKVSIPEAMERWLNGERKEGKQSARLT